MISSGGKEPAFFLLWGYLMVIVFLVIQRLLVHYMKGRRSPYVYILREGIFPDFIFPNITKVLFKGLDMFTNY